MLPVGRTRYIDFSLADVDSNPVPGRTLSVWRTAPNSLIFLRDMVACADPLTLMDYGDGRYTIHYAPSAPGHDFLRIYDQATDIATQDAEDIVPADFASGSGSAFVLNENFGGTAALLITLPAPDTFLLQVYLSSDWEKGLRSNANAFGATPLNRNGTWVNSITVPTGVYHIVLSKSGNQQIVRSYLGVG